MNRAAHGRWLALLLGCALAAPLHAAEPDPALASKAHAILNANCHRCHGQDGAVEGGMNFILDRDKLVARKKVVPGKPDESPLFKRVSTGKMPPAGEQPRPSDADVEILRQWIDSGAPAATPRAERPILTDAAVYDLMLADLDKQERRSRRFLRYFSLAALSNAGAGDDELQTYRHALAKLANSLSWHPKIALPMPIDPDGLVLRIDLRDYQWDANLWNRVLTDYPYGVLIDTAAARAVVVGTASRMPVVRLDWFVANASRAPLYYDVLQIPTNLAELERQLRVDVALDVQQERVARLGFNGSGISRNNRLLERHDAQNGVYWRTYDFDAIPQDLPNRDNLLPDRRNLFAYPLGPAGTADSFQHTAGEAIFSLPNGLHGYCLVNANNVRQDKGNTAIVSDPKRPDRAVEAGVSCMSCHARGVNVKDDQIRDHVGKNPKSFKKADAELVRALYLPKDKMRALMDDDAEKFRKAVEKTGNKISVVEPVMLVTLRYEADVDLPTLAAEAGLKPDDLLARINASESLAKSFGALKVPGGTVARQIVVQSFGDVARDLRLGSVFQAGASGTPLPDNTGEIDPLEAQSSPANAVAFRYDGKRAAFASADKTVVIWDVEAGRELKRCIGHTASVWCVAWSKDGGRLLSGGKDGTLRLWDAETAREIKSMEAHEELVSAVAFGPNGRWAISAGYDHRVVRWNLEKAEADPNFTYDGEAKYINAVAVSSDGSRCLVCAEKNVYILDAKTGKILKTLTGHADSAVCAAFSPDGTQVVSGGDDRTVRLWDAATGDLLKTYTGHEGWVKSVAFAPDGRRLLSGATDATLRLWDPEAGAEPRVFRKHAEAVVAAAFIDDGKATLSASRDAVVKRWVLQKATPTPYDPPTIEPPNSTAPAPKGDLAPSATIPVGGTVGALYLSPDRKWLYYLNVTDAKLGRVETATGRRGRELKLAEGTDALVLSHDGKMLTATAPVHDDGKTACRVQVIDPAKWEVSKSFMAAAVPYDVAVSDAGLAYVSGGDGDWTDVAVIDPAKEAVVARWGGVWTRSFLQLSADQKRLYVSSQGVTPGTLDALPLPEKLDDKPVLNHAPDPRPYSLGGDFQATLDGQFLLCKTGAVLRSSSERDADLTVAAYVGPFAAAAVDADAGVAFTLTRDGILKQFSYPEWKPKATYRLDVIPTRMVLDAKAGKLYVAGFDPRAAADNPRARGFGDVFVYELREVVNRK
jgi:WD40 repeat protein/mono/diheme cytochrome c family protein